MQLSRKVSFSEQQSRSRKSPSPTKRQSQKRKKERTYPLPPNLLSSPFGLSLPRRIPLLLSVFLRPHTLFPFIFWPLRIRRCLRLWLCFSLLLLRALLLFLLYPPSAYFTALQLELAAADGVLVARHDCGAGLGVAVGRDYFQSSLLVGGVSLVEVLGPGEMVGVCDVRGVRSKRGLVDRSCVLAWMWGFRSLFRIWSATHD